VPFCLYTAKKEVKEYALAYHEKNKPSFIRTVFLAFT